MSDLQENHEFHEPIYFSAYRDRRNFPRLPAAHLMYVDAPAGLATAQGILARTLDLSLSGIAAELSHPLPPGHGYTIVLSLHNEVITLPAEANRCTLVAEDLWEVGFQLQTHSKNYFQLLSRSFADT